MAAMLLRIDLRASTRYLRLLLPGSPVARCEPALTGAKRAFFGVLSEGGHEHHEGLILREISMPASVLRRRSTKSSTNALDAAAGGCNRQRR
jgi:hypothetical protein